jgi:hypothetical protein
MSSTNVTFLVVNISKIEAIVEELPRIGSRMEMKAKVDEILRLTELARQQAYRLADSESKETYAPNFDVLSGGRPKKDGAETPIKPPRLGKNELPTPLENIGTPERRLERVKVTWERRINPWKYKGED